jgi:5-methylcytosine-specific restriction endonuclease McrBC regulatory subunit McrC
MATIWEEYVDEYLKQRIRENTGFHLNAFWRGDFKNQVDKVRLGGTYL